MRNGQIEVHERIDVIASPDLLVVGGGPAGVGAALAAARLGLEVTIVEQTNALGGIATSGLHGHICQMSSWANPRERVVGGICHELAELTQARGFGEYTICNLDFEVEGFKLLIEEQAAKAGINLQNAPRRKPSGAASRGVLQEAHFTTRNSPMWSLPTAELRR